MISKKAKKYLEHQYDVEKGRADKLVVEDYNQYAIYAVELAEKEIKDKAIDAFEEFVGPYCRDNNIHYICDAAEHYVKAFKKLLNK